MMALAAGVVAIPAPYFSTGGDVIVVTSHCHDVKHGVVSLGTNPTILASDLTPFLAFTPTTSTS